MCAAEKITQTFETTGRKVCLAALIAQDDGNIAVTVRESSKHLEGDVFCTGLQDMYKGKIATVVHDRIGSSRNNALVVELPGEAAVKAEEKQTGGNGVMVDHAYDSDSSDGGIALSPSDLETELWAVIKTEDS